MKEIKKLIKFKEAEIEKLTKEMKQQTQFYSIANLELQIECLEEDILELKSQLCT